MKLLSSLQPHSVFHSLLPKTRLDSSTLLCPWIPYSRWFLVVVKVIFHPHQRNWCGGIWYWVPFFYWGSEIQGLHTKENYNFCLSSGLLNKKECFTNEKWEEQVAPERGPRWNSSKRKETPECSGTAWSAEKWTNPLPTTKGSAGGELTHQLWSSLALSAPDLKPRGVVVNMIPGLPAHILFMCVRYADSLNDANMLKSLMNSTINGIKQVVKVRNRLWHWPSDAPMGTPGCPFFF